jgi:hypothetical protein
MHPLDPNCCTGGIYHLLHHVDVPTTLAILGGGELTSGGDGNNIWDVITAGSTSPRTEVPVNVDLAFTDAPGTNGTQNSSSLIQQAGNGTVLWKLITGTHGVYDGWW